MKQAFSNLFTGLLVTCALVVAGLVVRREFLTRRVALAPAPLVREISNWHAVMEAGHLLGGVEAPLIIVEFADFQCPFCADARQGLIELQRRHANRVAVLFKHFPVMRTHAHAWDAALAAECAAAQGRFKAYHDVLFEGQDSIGSKSWDSFARTARVPDLAQFRRCMEERRFHDRVARDVEDANSIGVPGTPAFVFQGKLLMGVQAIEQLDGLLRQHQASMGVPAELASPGRARQER